MTTALIDGDIVAYQVAARCSRPATFGGRDDTLFDEADAREDVAKLLDDWMLAADCKDRVVLLSGDNLNFRKAVDPTYKSNRSDKARPAALPFVRQVLREVHGARSVEGLEADDLMGLMLTGSMADGAGVAVSLDKDLRTVPGLHCNPTKGGVRSVSADAADHFWMLQVLQGDAVDGYGGARGIGPVKARKALGSSRPAEALWPRVVEAYLSVKMTPLDALRTARLARILRTGDYEPDTQTVLLWSPEGKPERLALSDLMETPVDDRPDAAGNDAGPGGDDR